MEATKNDWLIDGKPFNRYKMMDYIVTRVANGEALTVICDEEGMPSMLLVYSWFDNHPEFMKAMQRAEEVRGHRLGEEALRVATSTDRVNVAADKLKFEALSKAAARTNTRFQDRQVIQQQDEYASMTEEQIRARIVRMIEANPALAVAIPAGTLGSSDHPYEPGTDSPSRPSDLPVLDCEQIETHDGADSSPTE